MIVTRRVLGVVLAAAIAACAPASAPPTSTELAAATAPASPEGTAVPVADLLPRELAGVELHTFATGQDSMARLLAGIGATSSEMEIAYAGDHGARFLQLYALRVWGVDGPTLVDAFATAAYDPAAGTVNRSQQEIGGKEVSVISQPASAERLGTFYAYALGDALLVAQTLDRPTAEECLTAMP